MGRVCLNPRPVVIELVEVEQPEEAVKEEVILDTVVEKVSIGNEQFSPSKIPIVIATYPSQVHHTPSVSSQNVSISSYHFKQPLPLDQLREMVCSSDNNTPGGSKSSAIKQPVLTSTPISMSAMGISRLQRAISTAISSSLNASQTTLAKSLTTTAAATHVRNLMFSPPDKVVLVAKLLYNYSVCNTSYGGNLIFSAVIRD